jgi:uncharacterized protein (TIGR03435 family)
MRGNGLTRAITVLAAACVVGILAAAAVTLAAQSPAFEVVSIKESPPPVANPSGGFSVSLYVGPRPGGRWEARNATLQMLLTSAYDGFSLPGQIVGAPLWGEKLRFDVDAIAAGEPPRAQMNEMVKQMLADRFKLKVRIEPREVDSYALVLARRDGKLGSGIRESTTDCQAIAEARKRGEVPAPRAGERPPCGTMGQMRNTPGGRVEKFMAGAMRISTVVGVVQRALGRPVVDQTGLAGTYDIDLEFLRDELPAAPATAVDAPAAPSISTALQEQLGLKVVPGKHQMDVLVIEQVEMPTPN